MRSVLHCLLWAENISKGAYSGEDSLSAVCGSDHCVERYVEKNIWKCEYSNHYTLWMSPEWLFFLGTDSICPATFNTWGYVLTGVLHICVVSRYLCNFYWPHFSVCCSFRFGRKIFCNDVVRWSPFKDMYNVFIMHSWHLWKRLVATHFLPLNQHFNTSRCLWLLLPSDRLTYTHFVYNIFLWVKVVRSFLCTKYRATVHRCGCATGE